MQQRGSLMEVTGITSSNATEKHPTIGQLISISEVIHMPDKRGDLNGSAQHQARTRLAFKTKAKTDC